jgi:phosphoenolpyruvate-protein kinase (PTS system EI component)
MSRTYDVVSLSPGVAVGPGWSPRRTVDHPRQEPVAPPSIPDAFEAVAGRLEQMATSFREDGAPTYADILDAEAAIARDPSFAAEAEQQVTEGRAVSPSAAVDEVAERHAGVMEALNSPELRERATDIRHVGRLVSDQLEGRVPPEPPARPFVLVADEVSAPDLLEHASGLVGAVTRRGGAGSHAAIVARSLGVPLVSGAPAEVLAVPDGVTICVDGDAATLVVAPAEGQLAAVASRVTVTAEVGRRSPGAQVYPVSTGDGVEVTVLANVSSIVEARRAMDGGAAGVGLLRTELAFLHADHWPTQREHEASLAPVLEVLQGRPVTVRLLDFSNDKLPPFLAGSRTTGPDLLLGPNGGIEAQLRALVRAGAASDLRVMVAMVTRPTELVAVQARLEEAAAEAGLTAVPPVGAMVELPETVDRLDELAEVADFFSIGSNDLTATTLGLSRTDPKLTPALAADPRVLRLVQRVVAVAGAAGVPVSLCGDAAADAAVLPLLLGAGVRVVSVAPPRLEAVRTVLAGLSTVDRAAELSTLLRESAVGVGASR